MQIKDFKIEENLLEVFPTEKHRGGGSTGIEYSQKHCPLDDLEAIGRLAMETFKECK